MSRSSLRRIQLCCVALSHIPLVAVAALLLRDGIHGDMTIIAIAFVSTLATAVLLAVYLRRAVDRTRQRGPDPVSQEG